MKKISLLWMIVILGLFVFNGQSRAMDFCGADSDTPAILADAAADTPAILADLAMLEPTTFLSTDLEGAGSDIPAILTDIAMLEPTSFLSDEEIEYVRGQGWDIGVYAYVKLFSYVWFNAQYSLFSGGSVSGSVAISVVQPFKDIDFNTLPYDKFGKFATVLQKIGPCLNELKITVTYTSNYGGGVQGSVGIWKSMGLLPWAPIPWGIDLQAVFGYYINGLIAITGKGGLGIGIPNYNITGGVYAIWNAKK